MVLFLMSRGLLLCFCFVLLLIAPLFSSRVVTDERTNVDDAAYIRLPSSQVDSAAHLHDYGVHGDGEDAGFYYDSSSEVLTKNAYIDPLKSNLFKYWRNAKARSITEYNAISSAVYFWSYEYQKHGGCTKLLQVPYAQTSMNLYMGNNITQIAYNNYAFAIGNAQPVDTTEFWGKINTGLSANTVMVCVTKNGKQLLQEIRLYIRTSDWKAVNYPNARKCTGATIYFA